MAKAYLEPTEVEKLEDVVRQIFRMSLRGIIEMLDLRRPIYRKISVYGHFGRSLSHWLG